MLKVDDVEVLEALIRVVFFHESWKESKVLFIDKDDFFEDVDEYMFTEYLMPSAKYKHIERYLGFNI